jgi:uncharacterized glyoxalase superfamily protein PhnB
MGRGQWVWVRQRGQPKPPESEKTAITAECEKFIADVLKPRYLPRIEPTSFNYTGPERQATIPARVRSGLSRPSRSPTEQVQRSTMIEGLSAITLATHDMRRAVRFYQALGFELRYGGEAASFTSFRAGTSYLNLIAQPADRQWSWWGRVIFYVADVDGLYERARAAGFSPAMAPRDAEWGERYFHLTDPDGHELSFARPLPAHA